MRRGLPDAIRGTVPHCDGVRNVDACGQPPVQRKPIDDAVLVFFADVALDVDATHGAAAGDGRRTPD
jgi:hypothetical protein